MNKIVSYTQRFARDILTLMNNCTIDVAWLACKNAYTIFSYGGKAIRFAAPDSLKRYLRVKKWHNGYLEVDADYGDGIEEEYIDLKPVLRNLSINPRTFLKPIKRVEVVDA